MKDDPGGYDEHDFVAEFYDYVVPHSERQDVTFFVDMAKQVSASVLEIGCGTGRVLIPMAREGIEIVGLDLSSRMLDICHQKIEREREEVRSRIRLVQADMRDFDLGRRFSLVTTPFRPFQHLTKVEDQISCLRSIHRHLKDGGLLVLDLFNPSLHMLTQDNFLKEFGEEPEFTMPDGRKILRKSRIVGRDPFQQVSDCELIYYVTHPDGRRERLVHEFKMRYLFRFEVEHLLARCGFQVEELYADYEKIPYGSKRVGELIFIARKV
jgi:SAM-dependent methyltransferase